ncbi:MAG TPA: AbrB/MazE/SpoVT family DNA-binding domain-containing protein [Chloroflexota bacterium]|jgi:AbrB family looped-hinge helix DNA binding protein
MAIRVKVSNRFQIAVAAAVRKKLHIKQGDHLLVDAREGSFVLLPEPANYAEYLRGLHRDVWEGIEPQEYVRQEREAWQK